MSQGRYDVSALLATDEPLHPTGCSAGEVPIKSIAIAKNHMAEMNMLGMLAALDKTLAEANPTIGGVGTSCSMQWCARTALVLAKSPEFRSIGMNVAEFATTAGQGKSLRMAETDFRSSFGPLPDPPVRSENRIGMMLVSSELLCLTEGHDPIHKSVSQRVREAGAKCIPRGFESRVFKRPRRASK